MSDRLQVVFDDPIVTVSLKGKTSMMLSIEAIVRAVWVARKNNARSILFDLRDSTSDDFHTRVVKLAAEAPATGITAYRMAFLGHPDDPRLRFIEDVAINRGIRGRSFTDEAAAKAWLKEVGGGTIAA